MASALVRRNADEWKEGPADLIRLAETSRDREELSNLYRHAVNSHYPKLKSTVEARAKQLGFTHADLTRRYNPQRTNIWPFGPSAQKLARMTTPAHGGIAARMGEKHAVRGPQSSGRYKGYLISRTPDGEFYSSLDPESWYETKAQVQRAIDSWTKGRKNPMQERQNVQMGFIDSAGAFHPIRASNDYSEAAAGEGAWKNKPAKKKAVAKKTKKRKNESISQGFYDGAGRFHPIRSADDYDPEAAGEARAYASRKKKKKANVQMGFRDARGVFHPIRASNDYSQAAAGEGAWKKKPKATGKRRRNPADAADEMYERFHGAPPTEVVLIEQEIHEHEHLAGLGRLVECCVETESGLFARIEFDPENMPYLSSSEDGTQLYIEGGDQELDLRSLKMDGAEWLKDRMVIGRFAQPEPKRKHNITYQTRKEFDNFELIDYQHDLGEETGLRPLLEYEPRNKKLYISGGQYRIKIPLFGISPGIEN